MLSSMIATDEDALICDFAEYYNIYDYRQLSPFYAAKLACGLRDDSRIKLKLTDSRIPADIYLLAGIFDLLSIKVWQSTKEAQEGRNRPKSLLSSLLGDKPKDSGAMAFESGEDFKKMRESLLRRTNGRY